MRLPLNDGCDLTQSIAACLHQARPPSLDEYKVQVAHAVKDMGTSYFHAGPPAILALLVVLFVLSRLVGWLPLAVLGVLDRKKASHE